MAVSMVGHQGTRSLHILRADLVIAQVRVAEDVRNALHRGILLQALDRAVVLETRELPAVVLRCTGKDQVALGGALVLRLLAIIDLRSEGFQVLRHLLRRQALVFAQRMRKQ